MKQWLFRERFRCWFPRLTYAPQRMLATTECVKFVNVATPSQYDLHCSVNARSVAAMHRFPQAFSRVAFQTTRGRQEAPFGPALKALCFLLRHTRYKRLPFEGALVFQFWLCSCVVVQDNLKCSLKAHMWFGHVRWARLAAAE